MSSQCYESIYCYDDQDCPLFETCQRIKAEEEAEEIAADQIDKEFLGDIENWRPTGLQTPGLSQPDGTGD